MRSAKVAVGLVVTTCLLAVAAAPALAGPVWEKRVGGIWEEVKKATATTAEGELELEAEGSLGAVRLKCKVKNNWKIGPGKEDKVEALEFTGCSVVKGSCGSSEVKALHLPWNTELFLSKWLAIRDQFKNGGSGSPELELTCVAVKVVCNLETSLGMKNGEGGVTATFDGESETTCGTKTGGVKGSFTIKPPKGIEAIRVK